VVEDDGEKDDDLDSSSDSELSSSFEPLNFFLNEFLKNDLLVAAFGTNVLLVLLVFGASVVEVVKILKGLLLFPKPNLLLLVVVETVVVVAVVVLVVATSSSSAS